MRTSGAVATATVTRVAQRVVAPLASTPGGELPLSWFDRYPTQRALIQSLHVFEGRAAGDDAPESPVKAIERALGAALVSYYPIAGRLALSDAGELVVNCTGEGVWFVEATACCTLQQVNYLEYPLMVPKDEVLPHPTYPANDLLAEDSLILLVQVTQFECGGFVVGFRFSHALADGPGQAQFMSAVGQIARGLVGPSLEPAWGRDSIPNPTAASVGPLPIPTELRLQYMTIDISADYIHHFKARFLEQSGHRCSTFEVLIAKAWQSRTRALGFARGCPVQVCFAMNARLQLRPPELTEGFYGNCYYIMRVSAPAETVSDAPLNDVVRLIREGKKRLPGEFARWSRGDMETDPYRMTSDHRTLLVSDWSRLGFTEVDYGWGEPMHVVPLINLDYIATCILVRPSVHKRNLGARLIAQCVSADGVDAFHRYMMMQSTSLL